MFVSSRFTALIEVVPALLLSVFLSSSAGGQAFLVEDINTIDVENDPLGIRAGVTIGSTLYFGLSTDEDRAQLWSSNGTPAGTQLVRNVAPGLQIGLLDSMTRIGSFAYFSAEDAGFGRELWRTDGTAAGTVRLTDVNPGPADSNVHQLRAVGSTLYFVRDAIRRSAQSSGSRMAPSPAQFW